MFNESLFSSETIYWETPRRLFEMLDREFHFELDVCATFENKKCQRYFSEEDDGLSQLWNGVCWMNPPYGREIGKWVKKAYNESRKDGCTVVCLLPARTDTKWWDTWVKRATGIRYIVGRLKFGNSENSAPFPSCIVVFDNTFRGEQFKTIYNDCFDIVEFNI